MKIPERRQPVHVKAFLKGTANSPDWPEEKRQRAAKLLALCRLEMGAVAALMLREDPRWLDHLREENGAAGFTLKLAEAIALKIEKAGFAEKGTADNIREWRAILDHAGSDLAFTFLNAAMAKTTEWPEAEAVRFRELVRDVDTSVQANLNLLLFLLAERRYLNETKAEGGNIYCGRDALRAFADWSVRRGLADAEQAESMKRYIDEAA